VIAPAGDYELTLLELGEARHPGSWVGPAAAFPEWLWSPINALLVRGNGATVLVDAGSGIVSSWWPYEGFRCDVAGPLAAAGVAPQQLDHIVLTHLDMDHAGGVLEGRWPDDLALAFPGVPVTVLDVAARWAREADPDAPLNVGSRLVALLESEGLLEEAADGSEPLPGLRLRSAPGHRVGHAVLEIEGGDPFVYAADVMHHETHAEHPEWDFQGDEDPPMALATRRRLLAELGESGTRFAVAHIAGPHALRVERAGDGLRIARAER
jgi:glyoxylase-like metal-dependent hydrolase (beta-lactamase superfamily II)